MIKENKKQEKGQIIVLLAVSIVVVMMVAALAVDGGMIYSERRFAQNAADASALAGGSSILYSNIENEKFSCPDSATFSKETGKFSDNENLIAKAYFSARNVAQINNVSDLPFLGYIVNGNSVSSDTTDINANHGVVIECNDDTTKSIQKTIDVEVRITSQVSTAFAHLIFPSELQTTNKAKVRNAPGGEGALGNAIVSLSDECDKGKNGGILLQDNNIEVRILNGGAFSNSCLYVGSAQDEGDGEYPNIYAQGGFNIHEGGLSGTHKPEWLAKQVVGGQTPLPKNFPNPPNPNEDDPDPDRLVCKDLTPRSVGTINKDTTLEPGNYSGEIKITSGNIIFNEGLYCLGGNLTINTNETVVGRNVTFYIPDGASVTFNGNAKITMVAPTTTAINTLLKPYFGLLFYIDGTDNKSVLFNGNSESYFSGMVYAPERYLTIGGNSTGEELDLETCKTIPELDGVCEAATYSVQFIGWQVTISGGGKIDIIYVGPSVDPEDSEMWVVD